MADGKRLANGSRTRCFGGVTTTIDAFYENGKLVLLKLLSLPERSRVRVTIESAEGEREASLKLSEESLKKTWDNSAAAVFNELLSQ